MVDCKQNWFVDCDCQIGRAPGDFKAIEQPTVVCPKMIWAGRAIDAPTMQRSGCERRVREKNPSCLEREAWKK